MQKIKFDARNLNFLRYGLIPLQSGESMKIQYKKMQNCTFCGEYERVASTIMTKKFDAIDKHA